MAIPATNLLQVMATWPVLRDERFDPNIPSPWRGVVVPETDDPLHPVIAVLFNHQIDPAIYASDSALGSYLLLTSVTDPSARNIDTFKNVLFNTTTNVLTFQPTDPLAAGSIYGATVRGSTRDGAGRSLERAYYWEFEVDASAYQGLPIPTLVSPSDQSVVDVYPVKFVWGIPAGYQDIPNGQRLLFRVRVYLDREKASVVWSGTSETSDTVTLDNALSRYQVTPSFAPSSVSVPQVLYWTVTSELVDAQNNVINSSQESPTMQFMLDPEDTGLVPSVGGPGGTTWAALLQKDPLVPAQKFRLLGVLPYPGYVNQDASPQAD